MKKTVSKSKKNTRTTPTGRAVKSKVDRKLVGVRIEPRLVKVMKAIAELNDCALGELIEEVFWKSMDNANFFSEKGRMTAETKRRISNLKEVYGIDYELDYLTADKE